MSALPAEMKTSAALEIIGRAGWGKRSALAMLLPHRKPPLGRGAIGRRPTLYATVDILRVRDLVAVGISLRDACLVRRAELDGRLPNPYKP